MAIENILLISVLSQTKGNNPIVPFTSSEINSTNHTLLKPLGLQAAPPRCSCIICNYYKWSREGEWASCLNSYDETNYVKFLIMSLYKVQLLLTGSSRLSIKDTQIPKEMDTQNLQGLKC